jgi:hypothetical protein
MYFLKSVGWSKKRSQDTVPTLNNIGRNKERFAPVFCPEIGVKAGVELEKGAPAQVHPQVGREGNLQSLVLQPVLPIGNDYWRIRSSRSSPDTALF